MAISIAFSYILAQGGSVPLTQMAREGGWVNRCLFISASAMSRMTPYYYIIHWESQFS